MNRDFFIKLVFATHRVADVLPDEEQVKQDLKDSANALLADLILFSEKEAVSGGQKRVLMPQLIAGIEAVTICLNRGKREGWIDSKNFSILEEEYGKMRDFLEMFEPVMDMGEKKEPVRSLEDIVVPARQRTPSDGGGLPSQSGRSGLGGKPKSDPGALSERQKKIIEFLRAKENAQVWEIQRILPEVTKRTLRRDLDDLLQLNLVQRKGEWNAVAYELK